jgi:hypothetical protein
VNSLPIRRVLERWDLVRDGGIGQLAEAIAEELAKQELTFEEVETVAKALAASSVPTTAWLNLRDAEQSYFRQQAIAAINAMRGAK